MQCVMQCMIVHEWNVWALKLIFFDFVSFFFIFPHLNECKMQMSYANVMIGLTNALCNHCALICYWQTLNYWPRCQSFMNTNKMWCKSRFFSMLMLLDEEANAIFLIMMQMSYAGMKMQSLFMMMLVRAFKLWCKYLLIEMEMWQSSNGYVIVQMSLCRNTMMQMFGPKHKLFKNSLYFQNEVSLTPETQNVFKTWFIILERIISFFKVPKNLWSLSEIPKWGVDLKSDDLAWKDLFPQFSWTKGVACFHGFLEKWILWKSSIFKKIHFCCLWIW